MTIDFNENRIVTIFFYFFSLFQIKKTGIDFFNFHLFHTTGRAFAPLSG